VILFDDVITTGASLDQFAERLMTTGATNVVGLFLAATYAPTFPAAVLDFRSRAF